MKNKERLKVVRSIFADLNDVRSPRNTQHLLIDIIVLTICGVICGAEGWEDIEDFGKTRESWLKQFLELPNGIPGHDTIRRLFSRLNPKELQSCFRRWIKAVFRFTRKQVVAIDGKSARRSYEDGEHKHQGMLHMVSAWAAENGIVLGQIKTEEKSNEITAIPELLNLLAIEGCIVTIDAMGCQKKIAEQIVKQKGDYILAVKGNQGTLHEAMISTFEMASKMNYKGMVFSVDDDLDAGHGRIEHRKCTVLPLMYLHKFKIKWKGLQSLIMIESIRIIKGVETHEKRYYISSLSMDAKLLGSSIRQHWSVENNLHWVLDVVFKEDSSRIRKDKSAENFSVMRHMSLNLLKQEQTLNKSIKKKRYIATMDVSYLEKVLEVA